MADTSLLVIILAAGMGTRMKSDAAKVMHQIGGLSMVGHVIKTSQKLSADKISVVIGPDMDDVREEVLSHASEAEIYIQSERLGTAHAVLAARQAIEGHQGNVLVLYGDTPLLEESTLTNLLNGLQGRVEVGVLGFEANDPKGYGRLVEDGDQGLIAIREEADASKAEKEITLCNSGVMAFGPGQALSLLDEIGNDNQKSEYYLTDAVSIANARGIGAVASRCSQEEVLGVNDRVQLSEAEDIFQSRVRQEMQSQGVTLIGPETVFFSYDTEIGRDVIIESNTVFGPRVKIGDGVRIAAFSHLEGTTLKDRAVVGPFARLRPGAEIGEGAKVGNFVEIKNAQIAMGAKINHLSYIGDASVGAGANVGAGTITCNYDGFFKHKTVIGAEAFIGSNSALIAPITIGAGAYVGSGSVISKNVPDDALAITRPERQTFEGWAARYKKSQLRKKNS